MCEPGVSERKVPRGAEEQARRPRQPPRVIAAHAGDDRAEQCEGMPAQRQAHGGVVAANADAKRVSPDALFCQSTVARRSRRGATRPRAPCRSGAGRPAQTAQHW